MFTVILFILILSLLVSVHEFGHFIVARKSGMRVYEFGLGFPPRALGVYRDPVSKKFVWVRKGKSNLSETVGGDERIEEYPATVYSLNWLPLGGFCKIKGESGENADQTDSFGFQPSWKRVSVLVAGVAMNILLAALLFSLGFSIGLPTDVADGIDPQAIMVQKPGVMVGQVVKGSPAQTAGVKFGDILRLKEKGIPATNRNRAGDILITVQIKTPAKISSRAKKLIEELKSEGI